MKILIFNQEAKEKLLKGIEILSNAVGATLGPLGSNVAISRQWNSPRVIHDGVSVAKEINLKEPFEDMGTQLVKEAAARTNDMVGDGTTTATILAHSLIVEGMKALENGTNAMRLRREMNQAKPKLIEYVRSKAIPIETLEEKIQVATISAQDEQIGQVVAEAVHKIGRDGAISVEEGSGREITVEYKEGMEFDRGFISPYFMTNQDKQLAEIIDPYILVTNYRISTMSDILPLLESLLQVSKDLVIIADDIEGDALPGLVTNKLRGTLNVLGIGAPGFGSNREELLKDIAALTNATFIDKTVKKLSSVIVDDLGRASKVITSSDNTVIIGGSGDVKARVKLIKDKLATTEGFDREKLTERLSKLTSGAAIIRVGAVTEQEMGEKKERVIDAVSATKAAIEEGVIPGGATVLIRAAETLGNSDGEKIIRIALLKPFMKLIENAGLDYLESLNKIRESKNTEGIDVMDGQVKDLMEGGIIDPAKVVISAVDNAISVAGTILTTTVLITDEPETKKND